MRFLVIDDSPYDRELIVHRLQRDFPDAEFTEVIKRKNFDVALEQGNFDIALVDYRLQWTDGLWLLKKIKARFPDVPVIMVTDTGSEEVATEGLKAGLSDYVLKKHLQRLPIAVQESLEKIQLRKQLQQAQKMESLGQLVGGIAHDFNNMLASIIGYTSRGLSQVDAEHPLHETLSHIAEVSTRAKRLTNQLLAFSRAQPLALTDVNLNTIIADLLELFGNMFTRQIEIEFLPDPVLKLVYVDAAHIEQVVLNLCLNACDAMQDGGKLLIQTKNVVLDEAACHALAKGQPGIYVVLTVTDTGSGMDEQVQQRIFEPFFTTKEAGKGTGLGLAVVYGIVGQHNGFIDIQSAPGQGTSFNIYLPAVEREVSVHEETNALSPVSVPVYVAPVASKDGEIILVVEDDPDLRHLMVAALEDCGYTVMRARDGEEGLNQFNSHASAISLVLTDIMVPKVQGQELYERISSMKPATKFLFVSGYSSAQLRHDFIRENRLNLLQKPFDLDELANRVREVLA